VRIGVIELGFDTSPASFPAPQGAPFHEDLQAANITVVFESGASVTATQLEAEHGMATLGVLVGDKDQPSPTAGPGVTGIVPAAPIVLVQLQSTVATAIAAALGAIPGVNPTPLVGGDVLLIEAQFGSGAGALPVSTNAGERAAIQNAVAQGIHVIEPAPSRRPRGCHPSMRAAARTSAPASTSARGAATAPRSARSTLPAASSRTSRHRSSAAPWRPSSSTPTPMTAHRRPPR
jgi:hypothetical protein